MLYIQRLQREDGTIANTLKEIEGEVLNFHKNIVDMVSKELKGIDIVAMRDGKQITTEQGRKLVQKVTSEEIFATLKSLWENKVSGLDGYNARFFKAA